MICFAMIRFKDSVRQSKEVLYYDHGNHEEVEYHRQQLRLNMIRTKRKSRELLFESALRHQVNLQDELFRFVRELDAVQVVVLEVVPLEFVATEVAINFGDLLGARR